MRDRMLRAALILTPASAGIAWLATGSAWLAAPGVLVAAANAALMLRRRIPMRIPSFSDAPISIDRLRWPGGRQE